MNFWKALTAEGSPPPMRGKAFYEPCASWSNWDHPRLCGEKPLSHAKMQRWKRITPAYAGKSRTLYAEAKNYEDHPRLCGEKA